MVNDIDKDDPDKPAINDPYNRANKEVVKIEVLRFHGDINI
jgi:hypothetical protein